MISASDMKLCEINGPTHFARNVEPEGHNLTEQTRQL